jgi:4-amino-4-deoxy-L-arabinose transferase-like glycosyltransferase
MHGFMNQSPLLQCPSLMRTPLVRTVLKVAQAPGVVFLIALLARLRVLYQLLPTDVGRSFYSYNEPSRIAWAVVSGFGYSSPWPNSPLAPTAQQPPVYPLLLAGIFRLAGSYSYLSLWIAAGLNAVFSAFTAVVILQIGKRLFGTATGILAAWVWSCWLYEAVVAIRLWESSLSALLLAGGLLMLPELASSRRTGLWMVFGSLVGVAGLTNTNLLSVFPFFWLWLWIGYRRRGISCNKSLLTSIAVFILAVLPWTIRNYATFHRLMPLRDNLGLELWLGNHEGNKLYDRDFPILEAEYNRMGEISFMEAKRQIALQFIRRHPGEFLHLSARRCFRYWSAPDPFLWLPLSAVAWMGMILALWRKGLDAMPYAIVLMAFPVVYYITHTYNPYRHPMEPEMLLLAAYATVTLTETVGGWVRDRLLA